MILNKNTENEIRESFQQQHIILSHDWLSQCLEWIHSEFPNLSSYEIKHKVYEQWLNLDFCEVEIPILPANIQDCAELTLNETIHLQLVYVIDISKPKYLQLRRIRDKYDDHNEDSESCGMLKLVLTDGVQEVSALEYVKINGLSLYMPPGLKVCLKPPISIIRGQIILKPENIDILGGFVEELEIPNSVENVLAKALGLPLRKDEKPENETNQIETQATSDASTNINDRTTAELLQVPNPTPVPPQQPSNNNRNIGVNDSFADLIDDDMFYDHFNAMEESMRNEENIQNANSTNLSRKSPVADLMLTDDNDLHEDLFINKHQENFTTSNKQKTNENQSLIQNSTFNQPHTSSSITNVTNRTETNSSSFQSPPKRVILTIEKVNKIKSNVSKGNFAIQAEIDDIIRKLSFSTEEFSMKVVLSDNTGEIEAELHSDVLTEIIGLDPEAFSDMFYSEDVVQRDEIATRMSALADKLNTFDRKVVLTIEANKDPIVTSLLENTDIKGAFSWWGRRHDRR